MAWANTSGVSRTGVPGTCAAVGRAMWKLATKVLSVLVDDVRVAMGGPGSAVVAERVSDWSQAGWAGPLFVALARDARRLPLHDVALP